MRLHVFAPTLFRLNVVTENEHTDVERLIKAALAAAVHSKNTIFEKIRLAVISNVRDEYAALEEARTHEIKQST